MMATAKDLRAMLIHCAEKATEREPNKDRRAGVFVAYVSGYAQGMGEHAIEKALDELLGLTPKTDGA